MPKVLISPQYIERYNDREVALADRTQEKLKCKDEITQLKKELQKATERARPVVTGTSSEREAQLQAEVTKCMVWQPVNHPVDSLVNSPSLALVEVFNMPERDEKHSYHEVHAL
jgi:hypothetical protein